MKINKHNIFVTFAYILCGVLCALPAVFGKLWILGWVAYIPVLINEYLRKPDDKKAYRRAWRRGFSFFYSYALVIFFWFVELYPLDFAGLTPWAAIGVIILAWFGIPILQAVPAAFSTVALTMLVRRKIHPALYPFAAAFLWVVSEYIHTLTWLGVPWGKLALGQTGNLYNVQSASLLGSYFVAFLMILTSGFFAVSAIYLIKEHNRKKAVTAFLCALIIFTSNNVYGRIAFEIEREYGETVSVAAIQANIASDEKWDNAAEITLTTYRELSLSAASEGAELIVWPETAFPYRLNLFEGIEDYTEKIAKDAGADIIVGCFHSDGAETMLYNSTRYVSSADGISDTVYSKRRLVPFGEFVPMRKIIMTVFPPLSEISMLSQDVTPGNSSSLFETKWGKIGSLICFDSIYETLAHESASDGAELFAISTNDSWFHDSSAVYEHNAHAVLRSIENGRYTVRAANTGISSIITDKGETVEMLPPLTSGYVLGDVKFASYNTLYSQTGNIIVPVSFGLLSLIALFYVIKEKKNGHTDR